MAEILITLGIIGVVASMTLPGLINDTQNSQYHTAAKKALSVANQAYSMAVLENGGVGFGAYNISGAADATKFNALKSQMKIINDCPFGTGSQGKC